MTLILRRSAPERPSAPHDRRGARPAPEFRLDVDRPEVAILDILERDRHDFGRAVDRHVPEKLQAVAGRQVLALVVAAAIGVERARAEGVVEPARTPGAGMKRARHEFPE